MRIRKQALIATLTIVGAVAGIAAPASAADTSATFTLTAGTLAVATAPSAALVNAASSVGAIVITGTLGIVTVNDARGTTGGWITSASSSVFTGATSSSSDVTYDTGAILTQSGTSTVAAASAVSIKTVQPVVTATAVSGNNTATWNPTLTVSMPAGALAGAYTGTVTTSVL